MNKLLLTSLFLASLCFSGNAFAQFGEPPVQKKVEPKNLFNEGYKSGFGFLFTINDFGFGVGGQYRKVLSPYTEALLSLRVTGIKDPKEQTYIDYYFGFKTTPDKYRRVLSFPLNLGIKRRLFAEQISDNFRVYTSISGGPVLAYTFAYFDDSNGNGFQENDVYIYGLKEKSYDIFGGWKNGKPNLGWNGDVEVGIDFGSNFASLQSLQFGYTFNYFKDGLQIMQPKRPDLDVNGRLQYDVNSNLILEDFYGKRKFYGSAQISFVFGWMWN